MKREKAIKIYNELKAKCPGLILAGSAVRNSSGSKGEDINDLDMIWVGKIFPMHLLPIGDMEKGSVTVRYPNILRFMYKGEMVDIHRTGKANLSKTKLHLTGPYVTLESK